MTRPDLAGMCLRAQRPAVMVVVAILSLVGFVLAGMAEAAASHEDHDHRDSHGVICACMLPAGPEDLDDLLPSERSACADAAYATRSWSAFSCRHDGLRALFLRPPSRAPPLLS